MKKNLILLALCQALGVSMGAMLITSAVLVGESLSSDANWATLPISAQLFMTMLVTFPAAIWMQKVGRRRGFILAAIIMMLSGGLAALAIYSGYFSGFVLSLMLAGAAIGFFQFFRFAAIDAAPPEMAGKAISWVLTGGLLAAFIGPSIAAKTHLLDPNHPFLMTFLCTIPLGLLMLVLLWNIDFPKPSVEQIGGHKRPLREIASQPVFIVAVVSSMVAYGVMTLLMTATPLAMKGHGFSFGQTAFIIQWHIAGMFAPSFFTGNLIGRYGVLQVMLTGVFAFVLVVALNFQQQSMLIYWLALVLLGIGWNFLFIGATTLLHEAWLPAEKGSVQGINDTLTFSVSTLSALGAGFFYRNLGWQNMNLIALPFCAIAMALIVYLMIKRQAGVHANTG